MDGRVKEKEKEEEKMEEIFARKGEGGWMEIGIKKWSTRKE